MQICETCIFIATRLDDERRIARIRSAQYSAEHGSESKAKAELAWANYRETERFKIVHDRYFHDVQREVTT